MTNHPTGQRVTRRRVVQGVGACAAAAAASPVLAQSTRTALQNGAQEQAADPRMALLNRASFGYTAADMAEVDSRGLEGWVNWQLEPATIADASLDARLAGFDWLGTSAQAMFEHPTLYPWEISHEARAVRLLRATFSKRQLFERIVEFWTDHFNIYAGADDVSVHKVVDDANVIRTHALGTFRDLLHASAKSPAMLAYLDNDTNVVGAPQENYAREVMELHTLGVDGPYTETDVRELARCFTGWTYVKPWQSSQYGHFIFRPGNHDSGAKTVLGIPIPAGGGQDEVETILDFLANHPSTIEFVTGKLGRWLLGYAPPETVLAEARAAWTSTGGDIKAIVRVLLAPASLHAAAPWANPKLKRPMHWIVSLYRAAGIDLPRPKDTIWMIWSMGQVPFEWAPPTGYPDVEAAWASTLLPRWSQSALLGNGWYWSTDHTNDDMRALLAGAPKSEWAQQVNRVLTGGAMSPRDVRLVQEHVDSFQSPTNQAVAEAFELSASSPSFLRY